MPVIAPSLLRDGQDQSPEDAMKRFRLLANTTVEGEWDRCCATHRLDIPDTAKQYDLETCALAIQAARDGLGIALGRKPLIDQLPASGALVLPFAISKVGNASYFVVSRDADMGSDVM